MIHHRIQTKPHAAGVLFSNGGGGGAGGGAGEAPGDVGLSAGVEGRHVVAVVIAFFERASAMSLAARGPSSSCACALRVSRSTDPNSPPLSLLCPFSFHLQKAILDDDDEEGGGGAGNAPAKAGAAAAEDELVGFDEADWDKKKAEVPFL